MFQKFKYSISFQYTDIEYDDRGEKVQQHSDTSNSSESYGLLHDDTDKALDVAWVRGRVYTFLSYFIQLPHYNIFIYL